MNFWQDFGLIRLFTAWYMLEHYHWKCGWVSGVHLINLLPSDRQRSSWKRWLSSDKTCFNKNSQKRNVSSERIRFVVIFASAPIYTKFTPSDLFFCTSLTLLTQILGSFLKLWTHAAETSLLHNRILSSADISHLLLPLCFGTKIELLFLETVQNFNLFGVRFRGLGAHTPGWHFKVRTG